MRVIPEPQLAIALGAVPGTPRVAVGQEAGEGLVGVAGEDLSVGARSPTLT
jgi:hypothetical protein